VRRYPFRTPSTRLLVRGLDLAGDFLRSHSITREKAYLAPGKVLVIRVDQLGDVVQTLPFFDALQARYPGRLVDVLTTEAGATVLTGHPSIGTLHHWDCPWFTGHRFDWKAAHWLIHFLRRERIHTTIHLRGDLPMIACAWWAGVPHRIGYGATGGGCLLTQEVPWDPTQHAVHKNLKIARSLGADPVGELTRIPRPRSNLLVLPKTFLAVHPDAGSTAKLWPEASFVKSLALLLAPRSRLSLVLVGLDQTRGDRLQSALSASGIPVNRVLNQMGQTSLPELLEILSRSQALLTNDSGPGHLAAALGKAVFVLWSGVAQPQIWRPLGPAVTLFLAPASCAPCHLRECPQPAHPCLKEISPELVAASLGVYLDQRVRPLRP
jgi:ADP-heptose:LPS heptosyltransferase